MNAPDTTSKKQIASNGRAGQLLSAEDAEHHQKQRAARAPDQRDHAGGHWDQVAKNADGSENHHGYNKRQPGCVDLGSIHRYTSVRNEYPHYSKISPQCNPIAQNTVKAGRFPLRFDVGDDKMLC